MFAEYKTVGTEVSDFWPRGLPARLTLPETTLAENLIIAARRYPEKPALIFYGNRTTYRQLLSQAEHVAGFLQQRLGVRPGDRVLLLAQNCPQFVAAYHGIHLAGCLVVVVNVMLTTEELRYQAQAVGATVIVASEDLTPQVNPLIGNAIEHVIQLRYTDALGDPNASELPSYLVAQHEPVVSRQIWPWTDVQAQALQPAVPKISPDEGALIAFTSGTTGKPKGCLLTHRAIMASAVGSAIWRECVPESVFLGVAPLFHLLGLQAAVNVPAYLGATTVLMSRWDASLAVRSIAHHGVTHWNAPPTMLVDLLSSPGATKPSLRSLKLINGGGGPLPDAIQTRLRDELGVQLLEGWGMTETAGMATLNPPARAKPQCIGLPTFGVVVRLRDPDTGKDVARGEVGEIVLQATQLLSGYWNDPQGTEDAFVSMDGQRYFRTGDLARQDEEGYYYIVDRLKRMIVVSGYKVWPAEVESLIFQHPAVQEACVFGMAEPRKGEEVWASVVLRPSQRGHVDAKDLLHWCREHMATYKVPRRIVLVEGLPRMGTGKFDWRSAKQQVIDLLDKEALHAKS